ncbi:hypothetical protein HMPREF9374_0188 [Desmospora sp. 8437]|nr:hypothetical protein HMPREF9374_0188 [Desmospora sp. 8437]
MNQPQTHEIENQTEWLLKKINSTLNELKYLKESSSYVSSSSFYNYIQRIIEYIDNDQIANKIVNHSDKEDDIKYYDVRSLVDSCSFFEYTFNLPEDDDDMMVFVYQLLKYLLKAYRRITIFYAIIGYRNKVELLDERIQGKIKEEVIKKSSAINFVQHVILPFLGLIEMKLMNTKMDIENGRKTNVFSIHIAGNVGENAKIGDFSKSYT